MKFKPLIGTDLAGHMGGIVASHNTYGPYLKARTRPVNPRTTGQQSQRNAFGFISAAWRALTSLLQAAWTSPAAQFVKKSRLGDSVILTGSALYSHLNSIRRRIGLTLITTPPTSAEDASATVPTGNLTASTGNLTLTFAADEWNAANGGVLLSVSPVIQPGRNFVNTYRTLGNVTNPGNATQTFSMPFTVVAGDQVQLKMVGSTPDGRRVTALTFRRASV